GVGDRGARLVGDLPRDRARVDDVDAAGVDEQELAALPLDDELIAVPRRARGVVDDRLPRRAQPVHERRLADVREPHDGDCSFHTGGVAPRGRPCAWTSASHATSAWIRRSISAVASLYPLPPYGSPSNRTGSPNAIEHRVMWVNFQNCVP